MKCEWPKYIRLPVLILGSSNHYLQTLLNILKCFKNIAGRSQTFQSFVKEALVLLSKKINRNLVQKHLGLLLRNKNEHRKLQS